MIYALIKDGEVKNVIKAEADFIAQIAEQWDLCVEVSELEERPSVGWKHENGEFKNPKPPVVPPVKPPSLELQRLRALKQSDLSDSTKTLSIIADLVGVLKQRGTI
jgi:hypothetical protein